MSQKIAQHRDAQLVDNHSHRIPCRNADIPPELKRAEARQVGKLEITKDLPKCQMKKGPLNERMGMASQLTHIYIYVCIYIIVSFSIYLFFYALLIYFYIHYCSICLFKIIKLPETHLSIALGGLSPSKEQKSVFSNQNKSRLRSRYVCMYVCMYVCIDICTNIYMYRYIFTYVCAYIYIHPLHPSNINSVFKKRPEASYTLSFQMA